MIWKYTIDLFSFLKLNHFMLTKSDLQQIRGVVREEVESEVGNLKQEFRSDLNFTKVDIIDRVRNVESRVKSAEIAIKREIKKVRGALEGMDKFLDKELMADRKRFVFSILSATSFK